MSEPAAAPPAGRPRTVDAAFWLWLVAAVLLIVGGLLTATVSIPGFPAMFRIAGGIFAVVGVAMAVLAGRARAQDVRSRRAALALALSATVVVALLAVFGVVHLLTLIALLPLIAGVVCITRPPAQTWFGETNDFGETNE
jgi:uncharacterized membrane protein HdeD (DUF308 family)